MKKKIIVWGDGHEFQKRKKEICEKYDVIAITDSKYLKSVEQEPIKRIAPFEITNYSYDKILICTKKYVDAIKIDMVNLGVDIDKVIDLTSIEPHKKENEEWIAITNDMESYSKLNTNPNFAIDRNEIKIVLEDKNANAGNPSTHYFAQDIWTASKIYKVCPKKHYDIGSKLNGFIAHLLVFREVYYIDIRPLPFEIPNLHFVQGDATNLNQFANESVESLSSLHAIEHFGLGRYGDKIDPDAYVQVINNIKRILMPGGHFYLGVPVGPKDKVVFHAHRIFSIQTILNLFEDFSLADMAIIQGNDAFTTKVSDYSKIPDYCCGVFDFVKA